MDHEKTLDLGNQIVDKLKTVYDPEIPVNIYDLGLIYNISIDEQSVAHITMTLTAPNCPVAETLPVEVEETVMTIEGIEGCKVEITFDPPWTKDMMSEEAMLDLGFL
ncbi:Fe-S protein maturation auxiliary factor SufT [bioreactor metagenome]|uniref:Fe-S protein maturation auxiliary factor SufT n=1 Tax=bioreactor metagenome TaxID=1076179 RepID=A0A644VID9_9ZZZZ|nr:SUF system Fe-S cluster assembly protein [Lentimicrobium sp.]MEA5110610.1 SUF system Fe-S cluster assembly protein [Lentimicrobium sp.]